MKSFSKGRGYRAICAAVLVASGSAQFAHAQSAEGESAELEEVVVTGSRIATDSATTSASPVQVLGSEDIRTAGQVDLGELLRESPALNASLPANFSALQGPAAGTPGSTDDDLGIGFLNLRNLGTVRTLVLVNGRRHVAGAQGAAAVDINTISNNMVKRVETLTGGASAVYGADAVSGVVNFIMKDASDFEGLEFNFQTGVSGRNDGEEYLLSGAGGFEFMDGRGGIVASVEYLRNEEVFDFSRPFTGPNIGDDINNTPEIAQLTGRNPAAQRVYVRPEGNPISSPLGVFDLTSIDSFGTIDSTIGASRPGDPIPIIPGSAGFGRVPGGPLGGGIPVLQVIDSPNNGSPRAYNPGFAINTSQSYLVGDGLGSVLGTLFPEQDRVVANVNGTFDLTERHSVFIEAKYARSENSERAGVADFNDAIPIAYDNPYIPDDLAAQIAFLQGEGIIAPNPNDGTFYGFGASRDTSDLAVLPRTTVERETIRIVAGLEGEFDILNGIQYELSYNYGETTADINNEGTRIEDRFYAALDTTVNANGDIVCRSDLDPTALPWVGAAFPTPNFTSGNFTNAGAFTEFVTFQPGDGSCVPFNPFGRDAATAEYAAFVYVNDPDETTLEQNVIFGSLSGDSSALFELPAGPVGWAAGFEYRDETSGFEVGPFESLGITWNGSNGNQREGLNGDFDVFEYFIEGQAPILSDLPGIEYLEITGAIRFADYSTIGSNDAWSIGGRWTPYPGITLRGTISEAVRAPNIAELFSPRQPAFYPFLNDPCSIQNINNGSEFRAANCAALGVPDGYDVTEFITAGIPGVTGGNPNLSEETAETLTLGIVFEPEQWVPGLRVIVDYYDIEIKGAIDALSAQRVSEACVDLQSINNNFCSLIVRDPQGFITFHESGQVNLGSIETSGIDFGINYDVGLGEYGEMSFGITGTHLVDWKEFQDPIDTTVFEDRVGEFGFPEWITNFNTRYYYDNFTFSWAARYEASQNLSGIQNRQLAANPLFVDPSQTGRGIVHDFNFGYDFSESVNVYVGINNAFDEKPYLGTLARPAGPRGRFFFAGASYRM
ncbi:MAG: TonB-dependent receptor [Pseudomonadales bacterium]|jgi:outer membrane receptor protein involved in Fe transport|nr:TonB-dependent receptor [Pseudomonadales bacterium]